MSITTTSSTIPTYKGSCHCGFITYTCAIDFHMPDPRTGAILTKCNCSLCRKGGYVLANPSSLTILTPPDRETDLSIYTFHTKRIQHSFCPTCGVRCFMWGEVEMPDGTKRVFQRVNVCTLDGREDGTEMDDLREVKMKYWNWEHVPEGASVGTHAPELGEKPGPGGIW